MKNVEEQLKLVLDKMNDIKYGFVDNNKNIYPEDKDDWDNNFGIKYHLQDPKTLINTKYGVCWDQVELERYYLKSKKLNFKSYFIVNYDGKIFPTHTFIILNDENKYYWLEHSWEPHRGIHKFETLTEALKHIKKQFENMLKNNYGINNNKTIIYEYKKPDYNIDSLTFFKHCESGIKVLLNENNIEK